MAGTSQGSKKAAQTRKSNDASTFKKMGQKGGSQSSASKQVKKSK